MADATIGAIMLIISVTTSTTPAADSDDTHAITSAYATIEACKAALREAPLSDIERKTERDHAVRVLRACVKPGDQFWYSWKNGQVIGDPDVTVEIGSYTAH